MTAAGKAAGLERRVLGSGVQNVTGSPGVIVVPADRKVGT